LSSAAPRQQQAAASWNVNAPRRPGGRAPRDASPQRQQVDHRGPCAQVPPCCGRREQERGFEAWPAWAARGEGKGGCGSKIGTCLRRSPHLTSPAQPNSLKKSDFSSSIDVDPAKLTCTKQAGRVLGQQAGWERARAGLGRGQLQRLTSGVLLLACPSVGGCDQCFLPPPLSPAKCAAEASQRKLEAAGAWPAQGCRHASGCNAPPAAPVAAILLAGGGHDRSDDRVVAAAQVPPTHVIGQPGGG